MATDMHLPLVGNVKKQWVYVAGAGIVLVVGYKFYQSKKAAASSSTTDTSLSTDANSIDPATGLTYSEEASSSGGYMYGSVGSGGGGYTSTYDPYTDTATSSSTGTNQDWLNQAESQSLGGASQDAIAAALTKVLGGLAVTQEQADIWHEVVGILGYPPQGYPSLRLTTTTTTAASGSKIVVETHQFSTATNARSAVGRFSDSAVATPNAIETALRATTGDSANAKYMKFYSSHGGEFPARSSIRLHVVKKA